MHYLQQNFNKTVLTFFTVLTLFLSLTPSLVYAATVQDDLQIGVNTAAGSTGSEPEDKANGIISTVINTLSAAVGIAAVIMIVVGGFRYITSGGDTTKVGSAKNTILYALIGLIIVALAQVIVHFVLVKATGPECVGGHWDSGPKATLSCP